MVVKVTIVYIEEEYLIVDRGGAAYVGELDHRLKPPGSTHVARWCVMDYPVQCGVVMEILGLLLGLVNNNRRREALPFSSVKDK